MPATPAQTFPLQHLFPLPGWCEHRLTEINSVGVLALIPLDVPADMRNTRCACVSILTERNLWVVGPKGVVFGGSIYLRTPEGLFAQHSYGYGEGPSASAKDDPYFRIMVGLDAA